MASILYSSGVFGRRENSKEIKENRIFFFFSLRRMKVKKEEKEKPWRREGRGS